MTTIYRVSAGQYDSDVTRTAGTLRFTTEAEALRALRGVLGESRWTDAALVACPGEAGEDTLVYRTEADADADDTGERAMAWIHCEHADDAEEA